MKAEEFLKAKGILGEKETQWNVRFENGRKFIINDLFEEFSNQQNKELKELNDFLKEQINSGKLMFFAQRDKNQYLKLIKK